MRLLMSRLGVGYLQISWVVCLCMWHVCYVSGVWGVCLSVECGQCVCVWCMCAVYTVCVICVVCICVWSVGVFMVCV